MVGADTVSIGHTENTLNEGMVTELLTRLSGPILRALLQAGDASKDSLQSKSWAQSHYGVGANRMNKVVHILHELFGDREGEDVFMNDDNPIATVRAWATAINEEDKRRRAKSTKKTRK